MRMKAQLIDLIYEAAFVPELWPAALEQLASISQSVGSALFVFADGQPARGRAIESQRELLDEFLASDTYRLSTGVLRMCSAQPASFLDVDSYMTPAEIEHDPMRIHLRSIGIGAHLCTAVPMPTGELTMFVQQRRLEDGAYETSRIDILDTLRPHLARASLMAARLSLKEARNTVTAMQALGLPSAVLAAGGRVLATNKLLDNLSSVFLAAARGQLAIKYDHADRLFQTAIQDISLSQASSVRSIPVPGHPDHPPMIINIVPLCRSAHEILSGGDILVTASSLNSSSLVPDPSILCGLFDLTPAEARLAAALTSGKSLKTAAAEQGIKFSSGRAYLERIFAKTGTHRQGELVALLKSANKAPGS
jgi:DNA-binding CsgD family transcriptional regulator